MNVEDLSKLSLDEIRNIKKKNYLLFHLVCMVDLVSFYQSIMDQNWVLLFLTFGAFVAGLALYDNYRISCKIIDNRLR